MGPEAAGAWHIDRERLLERLVVPFEEAIALGTLYLCDVAYTWWKGGHERAGSTICVTRSRPRYNLK